MLSRLLMSILLKDFAHIDVRAAQHELGQVRAG
jgi:hypothetical protein